MRVWRCLGWPHDHVKPALAELGVEERFWGVRLKPGKPTWFGVRGRTLVFGLPGNPVSAMVTFHLFARPALRALAGADPEETRARARLRVPVKRHGAASRRSDAACTPATTGGRWSRPRNRARTSSPRWSAPLRSRSSQRATARSRPVSGWTWSSCRSGEARLDDVRRRASHRHRTRARTCAGQDPGEALVERHVRRSGDHVPERRCRAPAR